jgi:signal transduction histidine kinase
VSLETVTAADQLQMMPHILIAEDDAASATVLRAVLERAGYRVSLAVDGAEALQFLDEQGPPDVLLLDWMLPGVTGLEVCHAARQQFDALSLPILMVTARTDAESISTAFDAGANDYITKPFLGAELRARIASHLRLKSMVEEQRRIEEHLREREKLSSLGLLVSGVAHDLANPLTSINGYVQLLLKYEKDPQKLGDLQRVLAEAERCGRIVNSLLSFARRNPAERLEVDVGMVLRSTFELRERHLKSSGIAASLVVEEGTPTAFADGHQLQQAFLNILINAEQALNRSGSTLRIRAKPVQQGREWVVVEFFNDGPPIPSDVREHIFTPFFTTKERGEGTGLGLTICQRILREHGGDVEAVSEEGGTTFRLQLPAYVVPGKKVTREYATT